MNKFYFLSRVVITLTAISISVNPVFSSKEDPYYNQSVIPLLLDKKIPTQAERDEKKRQMKHFIEQLRSAPPSTVQHREIKAANSESSNHDQAEINRQSRNDAFNNNLNKGRFGKK